jgi:hypothetical protein
LALAAPAAFAQPTANPNPYDPLIHQLKRAQMRLGPQMKYVSGGMRNAFVLAHNWEGLKAGLAQTANSRPAMRPSARVAAAAVTSTSLTSRVTGFTQSETSTAWCGTDAVVGFNDTGSIIETINNTLLGGGLSSVGYGHSTNASTNNPVFTDKGPLLAPTGAGPTGGFLIGDPVAACTSASSFYFSNVGFSCDFVHIGGGLACEATTSTVTVSTSSDGGATFAPAVNVVAKDATAHLLDKDWMAIDAINHEFYVSYTDFDTSGAICTGLFNTRIAIEIVSSIDGINWGSPVEVTHVCASPLDASASAGVQGSQIAIGTDGAVYVAWESTDLNGAGPTVHEIDLAKGNIGASAFVSLPKITNVNCAGDCGDGILQGSIRIAELPSLVAGQGTQSGKLFMAWNDGDNPQLDAGVGTYDLTDVKLTSSSDGGLTWSVPVKVNNTSSLTDHFQPAVASDRSGRVAVCFYDRRNDVNNFYIDRYCANSTNGGASFAANTRETSKSFLSTVNQDLQLNAGGTVGNYLGDYDTLAADTMDSTNGFRGGYASTITGAPNVQENKF